MPFGGKFDGYYQHVIKPAGESVSLSVRRADEIYGTRPIITDIWTAIWMARVIIADVTGKNANVNYELGLAHALSVPTILLTQDLGDVPFDYRHRRCIKYDTADVLWQQKLQKAIVSTLEAVLKGEDSASDLTWPYETQMKSANVAEPVPLDYSDLVLRGAETIRQLVTRAFGPHGVFIPTKVEGIARTANRQGLAIMRSLKSENSVEQAVMEQAVEISNLVISKCGDGSKMSLLMFEALLRGGLSAIGQGHRRRDVVHAMDRAVQIVVTELDAASQPTTSERMRQIAFSASGDIAIADALAEAFATTQPDGVVNVSSGLGNETTICVLEGMQVDKGYVSEKFVTNLKEQTCELVDCNLLITDYKLTNMQQILPLLEQVASVPLLVIAADIDEEVMQLLLLNHLRGTIRCVAIKAPGYSERRTGLLEDIAIVTGGKAVTRDLGFALDRLQISDLGRATRVVVGRESTTIFGGCGRPEEVRKRIELLRSESLHTRDARRRDMLHGRLSNIAGRFATVHVARPTPSEADDALYRATSAKDSIRASIDGGFTLGGGIGLIKAGYRLRGVNWLSPAEEKGAEVVARALYAPAEALAEAAGLVLYDPSESNMGLNVESGRTEDLLHVGIVDAARMLQVAVETAHSQAKILLMTDGTTPAGTPVERHGLQVDPEWSCGTESSEDEEENPPF